MPTSGPRRRTGRGRQQRVSWTLHSGIRLRRWSDRARCDRHAIAPVPRSASTVCQGDDGQLLKLDEVDDAIRRAGNACRPYDHLVLVEGIDRRGLWPDQESVQHLVDGDAKLLPTTLAALAVPGDGVVQLSRGLRMDRERQRHMLLAAR